MTQQEIIALAAKDCPCKLCRAVLTEATLKPETLPEQFVHRQETPAVDIAYKKYRGALCQADGYTEDDPGPEAA